MGLSGQVAIVTGGTRGIGRAIVLELANAGASVVACYGQDKKAADELLRDTQSTLGKVDIVQADIRIFTSAQMLVTRAKEIFGRIDIVVNNAGITRDKALMLMDPSEWTEVMDVNLTGVFNLSRAVITSFMKQKSGNILNITSISGLVGWPRQTNYSASKAGMVGFTKALAKEVAGYGIRVNAIAPGFIETDMIEDIPEKLRKNYINRIPLQRFGTTDEISATARFLLEDSSKYVTGHVIVIDGGMSIGN